jgi:uncharacterized protein (DUF2141 family)
VILSACAQVGVLSGGDKDLYAPTPKNIHPAQNTLNFSEKSVEIEFDEFIELKNPQQNIVMVPADAQLNVKLSKKTIQISWLENLQPNTTYTIYMNGLVKDITEGNDSLMTYVFSTGSFIDSLSYEASVNDAWTNEPVTKCLVGLFTDTDSLKPLYFSRSDAQGRVRVKNIKPQRYTVRAYMDEDKDLKVNLSEIRGFRTDDLRIDSSIVDTVKLRLYAPTIDKITSFKFLAPGAFSLASTSSLDRALISVNGEEILGAATRMISNDSLLFFPSIDTINSLKVFINRPEHVDTLNYFLTKTEKATKNSLKPSIKGGIIKPNEAISFEINDLIIGANPSMIKVIDLKDSSEIELKGIDFQHNVITLDIDRTGHKNINVFFPKGSLVLLNSGSNEEANIRIELKLERDYGTILLNTWSPSCPLVVQVLSKNEIITSVVVSGDETVKIPLLSPGDYSFRVIEDVNNNGKWDTGNERLQLQPETIRYFSGPKVRANWEVEVRLAPEVE